MRVSLVAIGAVIVVYGCLLLWVLAVLPDYFMIPRHNTTEHSRDLVFGRIWYDGVAEGSFRLKEGLYAGGGDIKVKSFGWIVVVMSLALGVVTVGAGAAGKLDELGRFGRRETWVLVGSLVVLYALVLLSITSWVPEMRWKVSEIHHGEGIKWGKIWFDQKAVDGIELKEDYAKARLDPENTIKRTWLPMLSVGSLLLGLLFVAIGLSTPQPNKTKSDLEP